MAVKLDLSFQRGIAEIVYDKRTHNQSLPTNSPLHMIPSARACNEKLNSIFRALTMDAAIRNMLVPDLQDGTILNPDVYEQTLHGLLKTLTPSNEPLLQDLASILEQEKDLRKLFNAHQMALLQA